MKTQTGFENISIESPQQCACLMILCRSMRPRSLPHWRRDCYMTDYQTPLQQVQIGHSVCKPRWKYMVTILQNVEKHIQSFVAISYGESAGCLPTYLQLCEMRFLKPISSHTGFFALAHLHNGLYYWIIVGKYKPALRSYVRRHVVNMHWFVKFRKLISLNFSGKVTLLITTAVGLFLIKCA